MIMEWEYEDYSESQWSRLIEYLAWEMVEGVSNFSPDIVANSATKKVNEIYNLGRTKEHSQLIDEEIILVADDVLNEGT